MRSVQLALDTYRRRRSRHNAPIAHATFPDAASTVTANATDAGGSAVFAGDRSDSGCVSDDDDGWWALAPAVGTDTSRPPLEWACERLLWVAWSKPTGGAAEGLNLLSVDLLRFIVRLLRPVGLLRLED